MIRLKAFLISIVLVLITLIILDVTLLKKVQTYYKSNDNSVRYSTAFEKYKSKDIIVENMTPRTLLLLGSSELTTTINENYHPKKIFNYEDFNIMQVGVGNSQNIIHAATIGSIGNDVKNNEIVMIQSIQWFDNKNGILKDAFLSRISSEHVYNTMKNTPDYNWEELDKKVAEEAKERTNNNDYQIDNTYYDKYIRVKYNQLKDSSKNTKYDDSKEYEDLDLLLSIVKDLKLNIKFAILPAHGKWSDYTGINSEKRQVAYNKLKEIAKKNNIEVMDYSSKEYEDYYMYDAMHLGWRGWIDFERDLYKLKK